MSHLSSPLSPDLFQLLQAISHLAREKKGGDGVGCVGPWPVKSVSAQESRRSRVSALKSLHAHTEHCSALCLRMMDERGLETRGPEKRAPETPLHSTRDTTPLHQSTRDHTSETSHQSTTPLHSTPLDTSLSPYQSSNLGVGLAVPGLGLGSGIGSMRFSTYAPPNRFRLGFSLRCVGHRFSFILGA